MENREVERVILNTIGNIFANSCYFLGYRLISSFAVAIFNMERNVYDEIHINIEKINFFKLLLWTQGVIGICFLSFIFF